MQIVWLLHEQLNAMPHSQFNVIAFRNNGDICLTLGIRNANSLAIFGNMDCVRLTVSILCRITSLLIHASIL